jgi:hypothetical protein
MLRRKFVYEKLPLVPIIQLIRTGDQKAKAEWKRRWEDDYPKIKYVAAK